MAGYAIVSHGLCFCRGGCTAYGASTMAPTAFLIEMGGIAPLVFMGIMASAAVHTRTQLKTLATRQQTILISVYIEFTILLPSVKIP